MKNLILLFVFSLSVTVMTAQVTTTSFERPEDASKAVPTLKQAKSKIIPMKMMQSVDTEKLLKEDQELEGLDIPFRFGYGFDINYTLMDGIWEEQDSVRIWRLNVSSPGAYSLNFIFSKLNLSPGAQLYIFNTEGTMVYGPVTSEQNIQKGTFLTDLVAGDEVTIQLSEPVYTKEKSSLTISRVIHAYKNMFPSYAGLELRAASLSCYNDVACYPDWAKESDAVALVLLSSGDSFCSGSLLNNTAQNYRPFFLTAFHCADTELFYNSITHLYESDRVISAAERTAAESWAFRFRYKKTNCNGSVISSYIQYNRANFRAAWLNTDFVLMELVNDITTSQLTFLGWDRSENISSTGTGIHHPGGDPMKISFDNHSLISNNSTIPWSNGITSPINTHWVVGFDDGGAEGGSSGSPLFDANKRVIGQMHGGQGNGICPPNAIVNYGQFHRSWKGGETNDTRLSNWLDPIGTGEMTTNTLRPISGPSTVCVSGSTFTLSDLPSDATVQWSITGTNFTLSNQSNTSVTVTKTGLSNNPATLSALISTSPSPITKNITSCYTQLSSSPLYLCSYVDCQILDLPTGITGNQITWACSSNLQLNDGNTGLTKRVRVLSSGNGTGWISANVGQETLNKTVIIMKTSNSANITGAETLSLGSFSDYTLQNIIEPYIGRNSPYCDCFYYTWTCSPNLEITFNPPVVEPLVFNRMIPPEIDEPTEPDDELEKEFSLTAHVHAIGCGSGWIRAYLSFPGGTLDIYKNILVNNCQGRSNTGLDTPDYISLFPNPVSDILHVKINTEVYHSYKIQQNRPGDVAVKETLPTFSFILYNRWGNPILQTTASSETQLNVSNLPNDIYFLHIHDGSDEQPVVKQLLLF